jgi:hypothetical protein
MQGTLGPSALPLRARAVLASANAGCPHLRTPLGIVEGFTKRYGLKRLVYFEQFDDIRDAIQREHNMKHWPRAWKVRKIIAVNPDWADLYETIAR